MCLFSRGARPGFAQEPTAAAYLTQTAPTLTDDQLARLISTLGTQLTAQKDPAKWAASARLPLWDFGRQIQTAHLSKAQERRVLDLLTDIERAHPAGATVVRRARFMVTALTIGKPAPEIVGEDLDGAPLRLSDYRGKVVALVFSGDWCGICRSEYPYIRQLLDRHVSSPMVVLGVDSSTDRNDAKRVKADQKLAYRSWWDGHGRRNTDGPIASAWNVVGWPTVYVLDAQGVIRFIDTRRDGLVEAVGFLVNETVSQTKGL